MSRRSLASLPPAVLRAVEKKQKIAPQYDWTALAAKAPYFDPLSDDEWQNVWRQIAAAITAKKAYSHESARSIDPERVRTLVDRAAARSGWFQDGTSELQFERPLLEKILNEELSFLSRISAFREQAMVYFDSRDDAFALSRLGKALLAAELRVRGHLKAILRYLPVSKTVPSASKPERDMWMGLLMLVWQQECKLPTDNSKHLRNYIVDTLRPYLPHVNERMAEQFISRWNKGTAAISPPFDFFD